MTMSNNKKSGENILLFSFLKTLCRQSEYLSFYRIGIDKQMSLSGNNVLFNLEKGLGVFLALKRTRIKRSYFGICLNETLIELVLSPQFIR